MSVDRAAYLYLLAALLVAGGAAAADAGPSGALQGQVTSSTAPLRSATVYAYQLADLTLQKVVTDTGGGFLFETLPAGLYKIIAFKPGFAPAVVMLSRATAGARQFLEMELYRDEAGAALAAGGFWSLREKIPADVLRDLRISGLQDKGVPGTALPEIDALVSAEMSAMTGLREGLDFGEALVAGGEVGIQSRVRDLTIDLTGNFSELQSSSMLAAGEGSIGRTQHVAVDFDNRGSSQVSVSTMNNRLMSVRDGDPSEVDFETHRVSWSQAVGREGRSDLTAQYTAESNFYRYGPIAATHVPEASRSWRLEGSYTTPLNERATLQAGFRYRELESEYQSLGGGLFDLVPEEKVEVFGRGGLRVKPAVVVEYGLYSTLHDGSLSFIPQGGVVLQLGENWQASTSVSHRIRQEDHYGYRDFLPTVHGDGESCDRVEEYCYEVVLSRLWGKEENFSVSAVHRKYDETLRLYFDREFYNHLESLYLVRGDRLPEIQVGLTRRLGRAVLAKLESSLAAGGGGMVLTADRLPFENEVRYLVSSLDTRFEDTSTGLFVAFHRLEQDLNPLHVLSGGNDFPRVELERLQLMLTQDLDFLTALAIDWAVHVNMEVSRGSVPRAALYDEDELRKRLTGGIALKF